MKYIPLIADKLYTYHYTGKFEALSPEWKHERFPLGDYELIVVTEGELYLRYDNTNFIIKKGEFLLLPPSENGYREGYRNAYCSFYWMHFATPDNTSLLKENNIPSSVNKIQTLNGCFFIPQTAPIPKMERMIVMMKQLQDMVKNNYPIPSLNAMVTCIILEVYGELETKLPFNDDPAEKKQVYQDILDYIQNNLSQSIKVSEIANHFGYNPKYLSHLFVEIKGIPLKQFILSQKIEAANFMLSDKDNTITQISEKLGFSDVHNFARCYKKITGLTPTEYRNAFSKRMLFHV
ncbi:MAG: AraC family transcriptional regulator [Butyrivibrio sp.]|nr:AraC family transcriptional regulator [Butyrivibrio sp.]